MQLFWWVPCKNTSNDKKVTAVCINLGFSSDGCRLTGIAVPSFWDCVMSVHPRFVKIRERTAGLLGLADSAKETVTPSNMSARSQTDFRASPFRFLNLNFIEQRRRHIVVSDSCGRSGILARHRTVIICTFGQSDVREQRVGWHSEWLFSRNRRP